MSARIVGGLIALAAIGLLVVSFLFLGLIVSEYNANGGSYALQFVFACAFSAAIAGLSIVYMIHPDERPRLGQAWMMLVGALLSTAALALSPPFPSLLLSMLALALIGGAWVLGSRAET